MTTTRSARLNRATTETNVKVSLSIDGSGTGKIDTPIGFLNHMLEQFAKHGLFDLEIKASGDTGFDDHHTVEDVGIVLGQAFAEAIGDKKGINRYGFFILPMDEALTTAAVDFSGRYSFRLEAGFKREKIGDMSSELIYDFWDAFAQNARLNLFIKSEFGRNDHHQAEGIFKACAKALRLACELDERLGGRLPSTKGRL
jgi:imidazoleglycerol-phosphate dehydratase